MSTNNSIVTAFYFSRVTNKHLTTNISTCGSIAP